MTKYQVLRQTSPDGQAWTAVAVYEARTNFEAGQAAAEQTGIEGTYVAVPVRSFKPEPFFQETITKMRSTRTAPTRETVAA